MKVLIQLLLVCLILVSCSPPKIKIKPVYGSHFKSSMRGLFYVKGTTVWTSGTNGVVSLSDNNDQIKITKNDSFNNLDFRDIHAFSAIEAIIMNSGDGCEIYKTSNAAQTWDLVYKNQNKGIFFDGMDFWDDRSGLAFSDPINDQLFIIETNNGGDSWQKLESISLPMALEGEAGFAASGTGIDCVGDSTVFIGTGGGKTSRVFISHDRGKNWKVVDTPMRAGDASGIYSLIFIDEQNGVAVGGNYLDSASTKGNCAITSDGGLTWQLSKTPPKGYMSCVAYNNDGVLMCTGRNGIDVSYDKGNNWQHISDDAYYSCVIYKSIGWLTGRDGKMAKIIID